MKMKVLNRLKAGKDVATELSLQNGCKGWVLISPLEPRHPFSEMPGPPGKYLVMKFFVPLEFLDDCQDIDYDLMRERENYYFDSLEEALQKAGELAGTTEHFDAPFNLSDFPL